MKGLTLSQKAIANVAVLLWALCFQLRFVVIDLNTLHCPRPETDYFMGRFTDEDAAPQPSSSSYWLSYTVSSGRPSAETGIRTPA